MNVGIIGAGAWGTALGITSARGGADVILWSFDGEFARFDGVETPQNLRVTTDMADLTRCDVWLIATPAAFFRETMRRARQFYNARPIIICTKGAEPSSGEFMSEILTAEIPECAHVGVLSGPQFAAEVANAVPTGSTIAGDDVACHAAQEALNNLYLVPSRDIIGAEICGVGKNAVALICGFNSVAAAGENERAMVFTLAWDDVMKIGVALGAKMETFLALCGIGDLFLSATSKTSRNFSGGASIAEGLPPIGTVEGIYALSGLISRAERAGIDVPTLMRMRDKMGL